ncbi:MAG TPA: hypothetical protein VHD76_14485 [Bryobacteraceae bacterium]|jgi:hypothetical protein|nr:hypothetical protein [Bryobacteraceae bacterium]HVW09501.1 hypothetical protein [Bryobacteraceae bacterium]
MRIKLAAAMLALPIAAFAELPLPSIEFPKDGPVALLSSDYSGSNETARGSAMVVDLHAALTLKNIGARRIRGLTLMVRAQEVTPGGKASVTLPSLNVNSGESFPVRLDLRLLRPVQSAGAGAVEVRLDGVLFDDLSFYGPDRLNSRRSMLVYEMEARRDRRYFKSLLDQGPDKLRQAVLASLSRQTPGTAENADIQVVRNGRATAVDAGRRLEFAFVDFPEAPVEPRQGEAMVSGNEARTRSLEVRNRSDRTVRSIEMGWILRDGKGREFPAGSMPSDVLLPPGQQRDILKDATLRFPRQRDTAPQIMGMTGYVSSVEFADGQVWIPSRAGLSDPRLERNLVPSPEEQRLVQIYRRKGLTGLAQELKRF